MVVNIGVRADDASSKYNFIASLGDFDMPDHMLIKVGPEGTTINEVYYGNIGDFLSVLGLRVNNGGVLPSRFQVALYACDSDKDDAKCTSYTSFKIQTAGNSSNIAPYTLKRSGTPISRSEAIQAGALKYAVAK